LNAAKVFEFIGLFVAQPATQLSSKLKGKHVIFIGLVFDLPRDGDLYEGV
jgi:hypothetical protein